MSENQEVAKLRQTRAHLVEERRQLAQMAADNFGEASITFALRIPGVQNAIEAVDRAIDEEKLLQHRNFNDDERPPIPSW